MQSPREPAAGTLILSGADVRNVLQMEDCIPAVESAFNLLGRGQLRQPMVASMKAGNGGYHIKSAIMPSGDAEYFVSKTNANYPSNPARFGLPTVQGTIVVHDARNGVPLAVMDSIEITAIRTAAASAVAAKYLAREAAGSLAIIGCGLQGLQHVRALALVRPVRSITLFDANENAARALALHVEQSARLPVRIASSPADAVQSADLVVTCTTSTEFLLHANDVAAGSFIAGVGVDAEHKRELAPDLLRRSKVVVDVLEQCVAFGDLHHAIESGAMTEADVHSDLGRVAAGRRAGRTSPDETFVFDSTGMALQDAACAIVVLQRARALGLGIEVRFPN